MSTGFVIVAKSVSTRSLVDHVPRLATFAVRMAKNPVVSPVPVERSLAKPITTAVNSTTSEKAASGSSAPSVCGTMVKESVNRMLVLCKLRCPCSLSSAIDNLLVEVVTLLIAILEVLTAPFSVEATELM